MASSSQRCSSRQAPPSIRTGNQSTVASSVTMYSPTSPHYAQTPDSGYSSATLSERNFFGAIAQKVRDRSRSPSRVRVTRSRSTSPMPPSRSQTAPYVSRANLGPTCADLSSDISSRSSLSSRFSISSRFSRSSDSSRSSISMSSTNSDDFYYGRHSNQWLFGGFSVRDTVKKVVHQSSTEVGKANKTSSPRTQACARSSSGIPGLHLVHGCGQALSAAQLPLEQANFSITHSDQSAVSELSKDKKRYGDFDDNLGQRTVETRETDDKFRQGESYVPLLDRAPSTAITKPSMLGNHPEMDMILERLSEDSTRSRSPDCHSQTSSEGKVAADKKADPKNDPRYHCSRLRVIGDEEREHSLILSNSEKDTRDIFPGDIHEAFGCDAITRVPTLLAKDPAVSAMTISMQSVTLGRSHENGDVEACLIEPEVLKSAVDELNHHSRHHESEPSVIHQSNLDFEKLCIAGATILLEQARNFLLRSATRELENTVIHTSRTSSDSGEGASTDAHGEGDRRSTSSSTSVKSGSLKGAKRTQEDSQGEEEEINDGSHRKRSRRDPSPEDGPMSQGPKFACPYFKRNPDCPSHRGACTGPGFPTIHRLKSHKRAIRCPRCRNRVANQTDLVTHLSSDERCVRSDVQESVDVFAEGFDDAQENALKREKPVRRSREARLLLTEPDRWREIYKLLFPEDDHNQLPTPFYEYCTATQPRRPVSPDSNAVSQFTESRRTMLPDLVQSGLEDFIQQGLRTLEERVNEQIPELIRNAQEKIANLVHEKAGTQPDRNRELNGEDGSLENTVITAVTHENSFAHFFVQPPYWLDDLPLELGASSAHLGDDPTSSRPGGPSSDFDSGFFSSDFDSGFFSSASTNQYSTVDSNSFIPSPYPQSFNLQYQGATGELNGNFYANTNPVPVYQAPTSLDRETTSYLWLTDMDGLPLNVQTQTDDVNGIAAAVKGKGNARAVNDSCDENILRNLG